MMQLRDELTDRAYKQIEPHAAAQLAELGAVLATVVDTRQRAAIENAALNYAHALSDAALVLGWKMREDPERWLFTQATTPEADES